MDAMIEATSAMVVTVLPSTAVRVLDLSVDRQRIMRCAGIEEKY